MSQSNRRTQREPLRYSGYECDLIDRMKRRGLDGVLREISHDHFVPPHEVVGRTRRQTPTRARHAMWLRLRDDYNFSFNEIAALFDRDHTTIMSGIRTARKRNANGKREGR